jgi:3-hydroxymyristoyl/3-hydroxydecanoyl-(acyl carrier protein) dehydratase
MNMTIDESAPLTASFTVISDHPALAGHFPGNPIVPGVLILEHVLSVIEMHRGRDAARTHLRQVKFLSPLRPDQAASITVEPQGGRYTFSVSSNGALIATGMIEPGGQPAP